MAATLTTIATQGHFGSVFDRILTIATQGHYDAFSDKAVISLAIDITRRDGGITITRRRGGIIIES
jgi:hypothetical protein